MKLPQILSTTDIPVVQQPQLSIAAAGAAYKGLGEFGRSLTHVGEQIAKVEAEKQRLAARLESASKAAEFEVGWATMEGGLRTTITDPNEYLSRLQEGGKTLASETINSTQSPEAKTLLQIHIANALGRYQVEAQKHSNTLFIQRGLGQRDTILAAKQGLMTTAADPEEAARHYRDALQAIQEATPLGGEQEAAHTRIKFGQDTRMFLGKRALEADPMADLTPFFSGMSLDQQSTLRAYAETTQRHLDTKRNQARADFDRSMKAQSEEAERRMQDILSDPAATRDEKLARLRDFRGLELLSSEKIEHYETLISQGFSARPSDAGVKVGVDRLLYQAVPQITQGELDRLAIEHARGQPGLNPADYAGAKQYLASYQRQKIETTLGRAQAQAEERIRQAIGMTSPLDQLDPENKALLDRANDELTDRSAYFNESRGGTEDPLQVVKEIIPILQQARMMDLGVGKSTLQRWANGLEAAKQAGEISEATYRSQRAQIEKRFKDLERRQQLLPPTTGTGTAPKQTGVFQKQTGK